MRWLAFAVVLFLPPPCLAGEPVENLDPKPEKIVPLLKGQDAPFSGMLVPEERYTKFVVAELDSEDLRARLTAANKESAALDAMYKRHLEAASPSWYESSWFGFVIGAAVTIGAVWAAGKLKS